MLKTLKENKKRIKQRQKKKTKKKNSTIKTIHRIQKT